MVSHLTVLDTMKMYLGRIERTDEFYEASNKEEKILR